jgi:hypothetical protein
VTVCTVLGGAQSQSLYVIYQFGRLCVGVGQAVAYLVEALCYKPEGRGLDSG